MNANGVGLRDVAYEVIQKILYSWPEIAEMLESLPWLQRAIGEGITERTSAILAMKDD